MDDKVTNLLNQLNLKGKEKLTPNDMDAMRQRLVNRYGGKIVGEPKSSWNLDEKVAHIAYEVLTKRLYKLVPDMEKPDKVLQFYTKHEVNSVFGLAWIYIKKGFWILLVALVLMALAKFVFH